MLMMAGVQMEVVTLGYLVYDITGSPLLLGVVDTGFSIPLLGLALFGGAIADRVDRRRLLQLGQGATALIAGFIAVDIAAGTVNWVHLFVAALVEGIVFALMWPARQAIIPQLVGTEMLTNAMALSASATGATTLIAPSLAGVLYAFIGPGGVYFLIAGLGFAALGFCTLLPRLEPAAASSHGNVVADISDGLRYIRRHTLIMVLLGLGLSSALITWPFRMLIPVFIVDVYHMGPESMGLMVAVLGGGSLIGSLIIAALGRWKRGALLLGGGLLSGAALLMVAAIPVYFVAVGIMVLLGLGNSVRLSLNQALLMENAEDVYMGRVVSVYTMSWGLLPLGVLPAGIAAEFIGAPATVAILGTLMLVISVLLLITQRSLRQAQ